jgi:16S rRNA (guanine527-N7)-methyltransferase
VFRKLLSEKLAGIAGLTNSQLEALENHYELLLRWNRVLNLTSIGSVEEAVERHYGESVFLAGYLPPGPLSIVDLGSGAGFPGFPVAVMRRDCHVTLVESHQRKAVFLREAARNYANVRIVSERAEKVEGEFDWGISRAVSYTDLKAILSRIAKNADLLTGTDEPPADLGFDWREIIPLPWGRNRFLRIGVRR